MPRTARIAPGGIIYHVLNRVVGRPKLFRTQKDFEAFHRCLVKTHESTPMRILSFCVMPTHWHLLLWPQHDGDLAKFMMRLTNTHVRRWMTAHSQVGTGHLYQGRYKSFAMQTDEHLATVDRYILRNAVRANLAPQAQDWPWCTLGQSKLPAELQVPVAEYPVKRRADWLEWVNCPQTPAEEEAVRSSIRRSRPYGTEPWIKQTMTRLGWREPAPKGRPKSRTKQ